MPASTYELIQSADGYLARITAREFNATQGWQAGSFALLLPLAGTLGLLAVPDAVALAAAAREQGVLVSVVGPRRVRLVTHLDVDDAGVRRAGEVVARLLAA